MKSLYGESRLLFTIESCPFCNVWKQFIERINMKLPLDKRINLIDCTRYYDFGIVENPLILRFNKYIGGSFPTLFFDGFKINSTSTRLEVETFMRTLVLNEFIIKEENPYLFAKNCDIIKHGIFQEKLQCV
jgi:hypothetical protein